MMSAMLLASALSTGSSAVASRFHEAGPNAVWSDPLAFADEAKRRAFEQLERGTLVDVIDIESEGACHDVVGWKYSFNGRLQGDANETDDDWVDVSVFQRRIAGVCTWTWRSSMDAAGGTMDEPVGINLAAERFAFTEAKQSAQAKWNVPSVVTTVAVQGVRAGDGQAASDAPYLLRFEIKVCNQAAVVVMRGDSGETLADLSHIPSCDPSSR